jgi:8-oxo-dGTP pyrophosphatase MutT (NUDIX family)
MRGLLKAMVGSLTPVDDRGARSQAEFLAALDRLERPCDEHADPTHVTASAIVTGTRGVVLHRHKRMGIWLQPGGHIEPGETPEAAALREVYEETGLRLTHPPDGPRLVHVDVHAAPKGHTHLDLRYLLLAGEADPTPPAHESQDVRWFTWDEAIAAADPGLVGALRSLYRSH